MPCQLHMLAPNRPFLDQAPALMRTLCVPACGMCVSTLVWHWSGSFNRCLLMLAWLWVIRSTGMLWKSWQWQAWVLHCRISVLGWRQQWSKQMPALRKLWRKLPPRRREARPRPKRQLLLRPPLKLRRRKPQRRSLPLRLSRDERLRRLPRRWRQRGLLRRQPSRKFWWRSWLPRLQPRKLWKTSRLWKRRQQLRRELRPSWLLSRRKRQRQRRKQQRTEQPKKSLLQCRLQRMRPRTSCCRVRMRLQRRTKVMLPITMRQLRSPQPSPVMLKMMQSVVLNLLAQRIM
mmetsp:Transcript_48043/g.89256  ORF Transcript_48043/g.89256 Transcript_48043/m.89256 type:complete len:288 (+) Transcript_48043:655-1518(+)